MSGGSKKSKKQKDEQAEFNLVTPFDVRKLFKEGFLNFHNVELTEEQIDILEDNMFWGDKSGKFDKNEVLKEV